MLHLTHPALTANSKRDFPSNRLSHVSLRCNLQNICQHFHSSCTICSTFCLFSCTYRSSSRCHYPDLRQFHCWWDVHSQLHCYYSCWAPREPHCLPWVAGSSGAAVTSGSGVTLGAQATQGTTTTRMLTFNPLHVAHAGGYTCQATLSTPDAPTGNNTSNVSVIGKNITYLVSSWHWNEMLRVRNIALTYLKVS